MLLHRQESSHMKMMLSRSIWRQSFTGFVANSPILLDGITPCAKCLQRKVRLKRNCINPWHGIGAKLNGDTRQGYCTIAAQPPAEARSINPSAELQHKIFYFDTYALVKKLQARGFSEEQATVLMESFIDIIESNIDHQSRTMVSKTQLEITVQQLMAHLGAVKKDMVILEKSEFSMLRSETEKQALQIKQFQQHLEDEMIKLKNNVTLDINLERSRAVEAHANNEKELQLVHKKIETEVAYLQTKYEKYKNDLFKYAGGLIAGVATICLGFMRLWS